MNSPSSQRLKLIQTKLLETDHAGLIITKPANLTYLIGLTTITPSSREAILIITPKKIYLYHSRFITPPQLPWLKNVPMDAQHPLASLLKQIFGPKTTSSIAIEGQNLTVNELTRFQATLTQASFQPQDDWLNQLRLKKDPCEIQYLHTAAQITQKTMAWAKKYLRSYPKVTEVKLAQLIEAKFIDLGADGPAFPTIVAFGTHTSKPHHLPCQRRLSPKHPVLLDFGAKFQGYCADMTRTFLPTNPPPRLKTIAKLVKSAYASALSLIASHFIVKPLTDRASIKMAAGLPRSEPLTAADLDRAARKIIDRAGYGKYFIHTTGHGLGLEIHEAPSLNANNQEPLQPGMALTLEPGLYLPGRFGYRHENTILLK